MSMYLSKEVREGLKLALKSDRRKRARLRVQAGDKMIPILKFEENNFAVDAAEAPQLRGFVDIFDGSKHLYQALIVASDLQGEEMRFEFKRNTRAADRPAVDFERDKNAPVALLKSH
ncbi:MAG: hypothetical protein HKP40_00960 [Litoreibacter sp.]|nr:hypothetical protein [Litoreibacter sp.]